MGTGLADNVSQGNGGRRPVPHGSLVGSGATDIPPARWPHHNLITAIQDHASHGSEANFVEEQFFNLSPTQQQEILDFLRSL